MVLRVFGSAVPTMVCCLMAVGQTSDQPVTPVTQPRPAAPRSASSEKTAFERMSKHWRDRVVRRAADFRKLPTGEIVDCYRYLHFHPMAEKPVEKKEYGVNPPIDPGYREPPFRIPAWHFEGLPDLLQVVEARAQWPAGFLFFPGPFPAITRAPKADTTGTVPLYFLGKSDFIVLGMEVKQVIENRTVVVELERQSTSLVTPAAGEPLSMVCNGRELSSAYTPKQWIPDRAPRSVVLELPAWADLPEQGEQVRDPMILIRDGEYEGTTVLGAKRVLPRYTGQLFSGLDRLSPEEYADRIESGSLKYYEWTVGSVSTIWIRKETDVKFTKQRSLSQPADNGSGPGKE